MTPETPEEQAAVACLLSPEELERRTGELARLARQAQSIAEREDGFELVFPGTDQIAMRLFDCVMTERRCCPFFRFEIVFEPDLGPVRLRLRGPEGAKNLVRHMLAERGAAS